MICWHKWKAVDKEILPSAIEQLGKGLDKIEGGAGIYGKPCIVTYSCEKCGAEKVRRV